MSCFNLFINTIFQCRYNNTAENSKLQLLTQKKGGKLEILL